MGTLSSSSKPLTLLPSLGMKGRSDSKGERLPRRQLGGRVWHNLGVHAGLLIPDFVNQHAWYWSIG